jgi:translation initiation factor IF-2
MELKANPGRRARGTVIEATQEKGRGIVCSMLVQNGTLKVGDHLVAGPYYAKVRALLNEREQRVDSAPPGAPVKMLGFSETPAAGDGFVVLADESDAKELANKRMQLVREQGIRTKRHITLDEIGRRLAVGNFKELKLIVKGDVDGSVEALSDALLKLSTEEIAIGVIHQGVGQITESDVLLASASDAIILGFQVRPSAKARQLAEAEDIDIRNYSVIYKAIEEIKSAMEGMLSPEYVEKVIGNVEVRDVFKISKVGTIAGCYVTDGVVERKSKIRVIRDGVVIHEGELDSLKRFKDDVKEVSKGYECGLQIARFNDVEVGDYLEVFKVEQVKRKL